MIPSKKQTVRFERGYKTWAENTALAVRSRLKLTNTDPLCHLELADHLRVLIWELNEIDTLAQESIDYLSSKDGDEWSAVTVSAQKTIVVINPRHSKARKASNCMHELAHLLCNHEPAQLSHSAGGLTFRDYNPLQEAEADWLAGCLILPRTVLQHCYKSKLTEQDVRNTYSASPDLYNYRLQITGVKKQFRSKKKKPSSD